MNFVGVIIQVADSRKIELNRLRVRGKATVSGRQEILDEGR